MKPSSNVEPYLIPSKRHDKRQVHFLTRPEIEAILVAPDRTTWLGRRRPTCTPTSLSRKQPWQSSSPTSAESQTAFVRTTVCSPSWRRRSHQDYADWSRTKSPSTARKFAEPTCCHGAIRHSSAIGINRQAPWPRPRSLSARRARSHRRPPDQPHRRTTALEYRQRLLGSRRSLTACAQVKQKFRSPRETLTSVSISILQKCRRATPAAAIALQRLGQRLAR